LKNVTSKGKTRKNETKKRSLHGVNEHFEPNFDTELSSAVVFQQPVRSSRQAAPQALRASLLATEMLFYYKE
jgi:hypothetical protein